MDQADVDAVLERLEPHEDGWRVTFPEAVSFRGLPVSLQISTEPIVRTPTRQPNDDELSLARFILQHSETLLAKADANFQAYHEEQSPGFLQQASNPTFWIWYVELEDDGPTRWQFVVEAETAPDYATHVLFDGLEAIDVTGGD